MISECVMDIMLFSSDPVVLLMTATIYSHSERKLTSEYIPGLVHVEPDHSHDNYPLEFRYSFAYK